MGGEPDPKLQTPGNSRTRRAQNSQREILDPLDFEATQTPDTPDTNANNFVLISNPEEEHIFNPGLEEPHPSPSAVDLSTVSVGQESPMSEAQTNDRINNARQSLTITVNGTPHSIANPSPTLLLSQYLREYLKLTGTKVACGEGGCGACTVLIRESGGDDRPPECRIVGDDQTSTSRAVLGKLSTQDSAPYVAINACLRLLCSCDDAEVITVEGLVQTQLGKKIQHAIAENNGSQCGYCTPGWVTAMGGQLMASACHRKRVVGLGEETPLNARDNGENEKDGRSRDESGGISPEERDLDGNLCRCTGYRPILETFRKMCGVSLAKEKKDAHTAEGRTKKGNALEASRHRRLFERHRMFEYRQQWLNVDNDHPPEYRSYDLAPSMKIKTFLTFQVQYVSSLLVIVTGALSHRSIYA